MREDMTDEEAEALDELLTRTTPKVPPNSYGHLAQKGIRMVALDELSTGYLVSKSLAEHKTLSQIIGEMVRKELVSAL
jgi:hypothetical protein